VEFVREVVLTDHLFRESSGARGDRSERIARRKQEEFLPLEGNEREPRESLVVTATMPRAVKISPPII
jgi:hypothetical protein